MRLVIMDKCREVDIDDLNLDSLYELQYQCNRLADQALDTAKELELKEETEDAI